MADSPLKLSRRERQCLELAGQGLSAKEISRTLGGITDQTVETYLKRARQKLGVSSSLAGAHALGARTHLSDVPPVTIASTGSADILGDAAVGTVGMGQVLRSLRAWLPLRKPGGRHNELTTSEIVGWIIRLTLIGTVTLSLATLAMAMVAFIWRSDFRHLN